MNLKILNGNNIFLDHNINIMEEYDYWMKTLQRPECKAYWNDWKNWEDGVGWNISSHNFRSEHLEGYGYLRSAVRYTFQGKSFSSFKAIHTRGDYKLSGWWDKFRAELYAYNGVRDVRGYMINISPKWPDKYSLDKYKIRLEQAIVKFAKTGKWKEFHYTIECGKNGDHLHAHCVCIPTDPKLAKTYIGKGNHSNWFKREFDNPNNSYPVGFVGCVKGRYSIQVVQINNYEIYKDKLLYLQEETKPEDHQNKRKLMDKTEIDLT